jgi:hypothetical protein
MAKKIPFRYAYHMKATSGDLDYVKSVQVPTGEVWCVEGGSYENETGARGTFRRYLDKQGESILLGEQQSPGAAELVQFDSIAYMVPGECMTIRQASATANDVLSLYIHGYKTVGQFADGEGA